MFGVEKICSAKPLLDMIILRETGPLLHVLYKNIEVFKRVTLHNFELLFLEWLYNNQQQTNGLQRRLTVFDHRETSKLEKKDMDRCFPGGKRF